MHFSSSFFSMRVSNGHVGSIGMHFLFFFSITVASGLLSSRVLSVYIGKSHKISQFSDSKAFSGLFIYYFFALLKLHSLQRSILATLSCLTCLYSCSALVLSNLKNMRNCFISSTTYTTDRLIIFFVNHISQIPCT